MDFSNIEDIQIGQKLQLYTVIAYGNEGMFGTESGWFIDETKENKIL